MANQYFNFNTDPAKAELDRVARQQKLADMLSSQGDEPIKQFSYNGIPAPISPLSGLAKILNAYSGAKAARDTEEESKRAQAKSAADEGADYNDLVRAITNRGTPAVAATPLTMAPQGAGDATDGQPYDLQNTDISSGFQGGARPAVAATPGGIESMDPTTLRTNAGREYYLNRQQDLADAAAKRADALALGTGMPARIQELKWLKEHPEDSDLLHDLIRGGRTVDLGDAVMYMNPDNSIAFTIRKGTNAAPVWNPAQNRWEITPNASSQPPPTPAVGLRTGEPGVPGVPTAAGTPAAGTPAAVTPAAGAAPPPAAVQPPGGGTPTVAASVPAAPGRVEQEKANKLQTAYTAFESTTARAKATIERAIGLIDKKPLMKGPLGNIIGGPTTGVLGAVMGLLPGTDRVVLNNAVLELKSKNGFAELQKMRDNSPTGGALGQVSDFENKLLQAIDGVLDANDKELPERLKELSALYDTFAAENKAAFSRDYNKLMGRQALPEGVTEEDIAETMRAHNMTREQVLQRLTNGR